MEIYNYAKAILPWLALVAAACSAGTATHESGTGTAAGVSSGGTVGQSGSTGPGSAGSDTSGTETSGAVAGGTGSAAGTGVPGTSGSMEASGASSGTEDAGSLPDTGGNAGDATMPIMQGPCTAGTLKAGQTTLMIQSGGMMRSYILHVPAKYDGKTRMPLVIDMHGKGDTAAHQITWSGWREKADAVGLVVAYPQGIANSWNGGPAGCPILKCCCEPAQDQNIDDQAFIRAVVTKTAQDGCIDLKRVYATGLSNGGIMSQWLACSAADMFAAVAPVSGPNMIDCTPSRPISVVLYRGLVDPGVLNSSPTGHVWPSAMADFNKWRTLDQCTDAPMAIPTHSVCQISSKCAGGSEVVLCSPNTTHNLYGPAMSLMVAVADVAWEVLQRHTLP